MKKMIVDKDNQLRYAKSKDNGISIVIPTWNGCQILEKFLPTVVKAKLAFEQDYGWPVEIIITDDASEDNTGEWVSNTYPDIIFITGAERLGFSGNSNRGMEAAKYRLVYLLNNDVAITAETLPPLIKHFSNPKVFAVASQVYDYETGVLAGAGQIGEFRRGFLRIHDRYFVSPDVSKDDKPYLTIFATGGSAMYDRDKFFEIGCFDNLFSPYGWEDVEISLRAWRLGYSVHYEPQSPVWHQFSSTIGKKITKKKVNIVYERNRIMAHWIHLDTKELLLHGLYMILNLLRYSISARWGNIKALIKALNNLDDVLRKRRELKNIEIMTISSAVYKIIHQPKERSLMPLKRGEKQIKKLDS